MPKILLRLLIDAVLVGSILFVSADTLAWPRAWVLVIVLLATRTVSAALVYPVNPMLLRERAGYRSPPTSLRQTDCSFSACWRQGFSGCRPSRRSIDFIGICSRDQ